MTRLAAERGLPILMCWLPVRHDATEERVTSFGFDKGDGHFHHQ